MTDPEIVLAFKRWDVFESVVGLCMKCVAVAACLYVAIYLPIEASHGETTSVTYLIAWITDLKLDVIVPCGLAATCFFWARSERKKRLKEREEKDARIKELELAMDPNRSSSNLTVEGDKTKGES